MVTAQVPVPEQPPPVQPAKDEPAAARGGQGADRARSHGLRAGGAAVDAGGAAGHRARTRAALRHGQRHGQQVEGRRHRGGGARSRCRCRCPSSRRRSSRRRTSRRRRVAVKVRTVPGATDSEQVAPQLMPAGLLVTVPEPVPLFVTDSVTGQQVEGRRHRGGGAHGTVQVPVPEQPPPVQPAKDEPAAAVAVKVRTVPGVTDSEQVAPQLMPAGLLVTVPDRRRSSQPIGSRDSQGVRAQGGRRTPHSHLVRRRSQIGRTPTRYWRPHSRGTTSAAASREV